MKSFKLEKSAPKDSLRSGGIFALALSIPLLLVIGLLAGAISLAGVFLILASYGE